MIEYLGRSQPTYWHYMPRRSEQQRWTRLSEQSFSARSALMTKNSRLHHVIHHRRHNLYFFFAITACSFSQWMSPAEQLVP